MGKKLNKEKKAKKNNKAEGVEEVKNKEKVTQEQIKVAATVLMDMLSSKYSTNTTSYLADKLTEVISEYKTTHKVVKVLNEYSLEVQYSKEKIKDFLKNVEGDYKEEPLLSSFIKKIRYNKIDFTDLVYIFIICIQTEAKHINFGYLIGETADNSKLTCKVKLPKQIQFWVVEQAIREITGIPKEYTPNITDVMQVLKSKGADVHNLIINKISDILELQEKESALSVTDTDFSKVIMPKEKETSDEDDYYEEETSDEDEEYLSDEDDDYAEDLSDEDDEEDLSDNDYADFFNSTDKITDTWRKLTFNYSNKSSVMKTLHRIFQSGNAYMLRVSHHLDLLSSTTFETEVLVSVGYDLLHINGSSKCVSFNDLADMLIQYKDITTLYYRRD